MRGGDAAILWADGKNQDLPLHQFVHEWEAEVKKQAGNPVFKELAPLFPKMRWFTARAEVRRPS